VNLRELLEEEGRDLPGLESTVAPDGSTTWSRGGRPFGVATADGSSAEFALDPAVADAAARTPDVRLSSRGPGWVTFAPAELDDHAADRAVAWLASAHRRLGLQN
jgi:transcription elongation factor